MGVCVKLVFLCLFLWVKQSSPKSPARDSTTDISELKDESVSNVSTVPSHWTDLSVNETINSQMTDIVSNVSKVPSHWTELAVNKTNMTDTVSNVSKIPSHWTDLAVNETNNSQMTDISVSNVSKVPLDWTDLAMNVTNMTDIVSNVSKVPSNWTGLAVNLTNTDFVPSNFTETATRRVSVNDDRAINTKSTGGGQEHLVNEYTTIAVNTHSTAAVNSHSTAVNEHSTAVNSHSTAVNSYSTAVNSHSTAVVNSHSTTVVNSHSTAVVNSHSTAVVNSHSTAVVNSHSTAVVNSHSTAVVNSHSTAVVNTHSTPVVNGHSTPVVSTRTEPTQGDQSTDTTHVAERNVHDTTTPIPSLFIIADISHFHHRVDTGWQNQSVEDVLLSGLCQASTRCLQSPGEAVTSDDCANVDCFPCQCPPCSMGLCCLSDLPTAALRSGQHTGCMQNGYTGIVRCPVDRSLNDRVVIACEKDAGTFTTDEPVSDVKTNITFRNKHCAECHGVTEYVSWDISVACAHFQYVYTALSEEELIDKVSASDRSGCRVSTAPPEDVATHSCSDERAKWYTPGVIASCNTTGLWESLDTNVDENCRQYKAFSLRVRPRHASADLVFQNVYCAECNGFPLEPAMCPMRPPTLGQGFRWRKRLPPALTLLLGLGRSDLHEEEWSLSGTDRAIITTCSDGAWLDFDDVCRNVSCTAGKTLLGGDNSTCGTAIPMIRGLSYDLDMTLIPRGLFKLRDEASDWRVLRQSLARQLDAKTRGQADQYTVWFYPSIGPANQGGMMVVTRVRVVGVVVAGREISRDEFERRVVGSLMMSDWIATDGENNTVTFTYLHASLPNDTEPSNLLRFRSSYSASRNMIVLLSDLNIPLTPLLLCPFVHFQTPEFRVLPHPNHDDPIEILLIFDTSEVKLPNITRADLTNDSIRVCVEALERLPRPLDRSPAVPRHSPLWQYALTMTAIPLSIVCLLVILVVYAVLPALRTQPGVNTMGTCCSLLLAQLSLLLASHRVVSGAWCTALGVWVHVSWLSTFCWTSVSSVHMFRTFSCVAFSAHKTGASLQRLARNVALTTVLPGVVVGAVMVVSFLTTSGQSVGYSSTRCYLDSPWLVGLSVILPLSLIILVNIVLFVLTVRRIRSVVRLNAARAKHETEHERHHVTACVRLSLLTGATWLLSLVAEGLDLDWLRAVSILANGGQGALLLLSYVTTRRVLDLLAARLGCGVKDVNTSSLTPTFKPVFLESVRTLHTHLSARESSAAGETAT